MPDFVESLIDSFVEQGYGTKVDESTIRSDVNGTEVSFDVEYTEDSIESLTVFADGTEVETIPNDENFASRLTTILSTELDF